MFRETSGGKVIRGPWGHEEPLAGAFADLIRAGWCTPSEARAMLRVIRSPRPDRQAV